MNVQVNLYFLFCIYDAEFDLELLLFSDSDRCPVRSFLKYMRRLNPLCVNFFQKPRNEPIEDIYYNNMALGHNKLGSFMKNLSESAGLSRIYTNHSLRATTVHVLDSARIPSRHIMSVTGHKSESSLKTYSGQTDKHTKKLMSKKLSENTNLLNINRTAAVLDAPFEILPLTNSQELALVDDTLGLNDGLDDLFMKVDMPKSPQRTSNICVNAQSNSIHNPFPVFNNCSNITVNCYFGTGSKN